MPAATIHSVVDGWAGDQKRQRVILTTANTTDTVLPNTVGLKRITGVQLTNRTGTLDGRDSTHASVTIGTITDYSTANVLQCATAKFEVFVYGF